MNTFGNVLFHTIVVSALVFVAPAQRASVAIPPPSNLSLTCHNFEIIAKWDYVSGGPPTRFRVRLEKEISDPETIETDQHHFNVSSLITSVENSYYLRVRAINGSAESEDVTSATFSYDKFMPAQFRCLLDFPSVNLTVKEGMITVSFEHPFHWYETSSVMRSLKKKAPTEYEKHKIFHYEVKVGEDKQQFECNAEGNPCSGNFAIQQQEEVYCVRLAGMMKNTIVNMTETVCRSEALKTCCSHIVAPVVAFVVFITIVFILTGVVVFIQLTKATVHTKIFILKKCSEWTTIQPEPTDISPLYFIKSTISPQQQEHEEEPLVQTTTSSTKKSFYNGCNYMLKWSDDQESVGDQQVLDTSAATNGPSLCEYEAKPRHADVDHVNVWPDSYDRGHLVQDL